MGHDSGSASSPAANAIRSINCATTLARPRANTRYSTYTQRSRQTPKISDARRRASFTEQPVQLDELSREVQRDPYKTFLYLAYGSNLSAETFRGKRNIQPISQTNVVVPEIQLTFDLAGIPYTEPCFGNCRYRDASETPAGYGTNDYHKDRWKKGLVGVVYEVTAEDYAHIIATEGGGSGYKDVLVDCYVLDDNPELEVPPKPATESFKAHTLFAPASRGRPDSSYAQPSARYKKLITDGAEEHDLPHEYRDFLDGLRTYSMTTTRQRMGQWVFLILWMPIIQFLFLGGARIFLRKDGTYPKWFREFSSAIFRGVWASYDGFFKPTFGDGERTISDEDEEMVKGQRVHVDDEKVPLL